MKATDILQRLGLDAVVPAAPFTTAADDTHRDCFGDRVVFGSQHLLQALHAVIEAERAGAWRTTTKSIGYSCGKQLAAQLDAQLSAAGKPALAALPLEACLALLERLFAARGWGQLTVDLAHIEHAVLVARLEHSCFAEALGKGAPFADALLAGLLRGFFEHLTGQELEAEEIACVGSGAAYCTFAIAAPAAITGIMPRIGQEDAEAIIAQLVAAST